MKGTKRAVVLVQEIASMLKFQIVFRFSTYFAWEIHCKVLRINVRNYRLNSQICIQYKRRPCPTATTAINNLVSLQPSTSTQATLPYRLFVRQLWGIRYCQDNRTTLDHSAAYKVFFTDAHHIQLIFKE